MFLEVGKTYLTRDGLAVEIISQHETTGPYAMLGRMVEGGALLYYDTSGRHGEEETLTDLIREAGIEPASIAAKPRSMMALLDAAVSENQQIGTAE